MTRTIRYADDAESLFFPGRADDFFPLGGAVSEAALCAEMARLAYVKHEVPSEKARLDRVLDKIGFSIADPFDAQGTQGFVADGRTGEGEGIRVIAFRGTEPDDPRDLLADLEAWPSSWGGAARVHKGFARALQRVETKIAAAVNESPTRVVVTGHSLGAALATLVASRYAGSRLYTFGAPRVGNAAFVAMIARERHWRYVDHVDAVTTVPPHLTGLGYVHPEPASFIDAGGLVHPDLTDAEIRQRQAAAGSRQLSIADILQTFRGASGTKERRIAVRDLTDHAPINYVAALMRLPAQ
jgi:hypothetical protein